MTISEKQRQKKLQQKKRKRLDAARAAHHGASPSRTKASAYAHLPIHECLVPSKLFELGMGSVLFARRTAGGQIAVSTFLVDTFCLGVKDAFFTCLDLVTYEQELKARTEGLLAHGRLEAIHPTCAGKLLEGAVAYASDLGFPPHADYRNARGIFGDVDGKACPTRFEFGKGGKPFYFRGPGETQSQARRIVEQLHRRCGPDNYDFLIASGDGFDL